MDAIKHPRYYLGAVGFAGLQVIFVTLTGQGVTHFTSIGLTQSEIALILLSGPICGAFIQPCFGRWSDKTHTSWGRRKPFIIIGAIVLNLALLALAWVEVIIQISVPSAVSLEKRRACLVVLTSLLTFSVWASVQAVQIGLRTLITDACSHDEQSQANAWASRYSNFAAVIANFLAYVNFLPRATSGSHTFKNMALLATLVLTMTVSVSCLGVRGKSHAVASLSIGRSRAVWRDIWRVFFGSPNQIRTVCLVQFFAWMGWFPFLYYTVTYIDILHHAELLKKGTLKDASYSEELRRGLLALVIYSSVSLFSAVTLPHLVMVRRLFSMRRLWITSQAVFAISTLGTFITSSSSATIVLFGIVGFSWAATSWIPYALLGTETTYSPLPQGSRLVVLDDSEGDEFKYHDDEHDEHDLSNDAGLVYGIHNFSICLPQMAITLGMGFERIIAGHETKNHANPDSGLVAVFRLAGMFALVAMYIAQGIQGPR